MERNNEEPSSPTRMTLEEIQGVIGDENDAQNDETNIDSPSPNPNIYNSILETNMIWVQARSLSQVELDRAFIQNLQIQEWMLSNMSGPNNPHDNMNLNSMSNEELIALEEANRDFHNYLYDINIEDISYEELITLIEATGRVSKGLSAQSIAKLEQFTYGSNSKDHLDGDDQEKCVICQYEYEEGNKVMRLPCTHQYHYECIQQWLQDNKVCPLCNAEVTISE